VEHLDRYDRCARTGESTKAISDAGKKLKEIVRMFMLGITTCALVCAISGDGNLSSQYNVSDQEDVAKSQLMFRPTTGASGRTTGGARFSVQAYEASDGASISSRLVRFTSATRAQRELQKSVRNTRVVKRYPRLDRAGRLIGEKIVVRVAAKKSGESYFAVLWVDGNELHRITGPSLRHVSEFEKQYYP
jgi:hypothetical protein